jgi:PAS domain S-box-containing protein
MATASSLDAALVLRALGAATPDLIYVIARDGRYLFVNDAAANVLGFSPADMIGRRWLELGFPADREEEFVSERERVLETGIASKREVTFPTPTGSRTFDYVVSPMYDDQSRSAGVVVVSRDVSEQRSAERRYRDLADAMPQIVWSARADGTTDYYNRRWYEFTGAERDVTGDASFVPILHPEDQERTVAVWHAAVETGQPYQTEYRLFDKASGTYRWHLARALPVLDANGRIVRWYGTSTDIDELKSAEETLERQNFMLRILMDVSEILTAELDLGRLLHSITVAATMLAGAEFGAFYIGPELHAVTGIAPDAIDSFPVQSSMEVPVTARSGVVGRLVFGHSQPSKFGEEAERLVAGVAAQAAIAIENARAAAGIRNEEARYRTLVTATAQIVWSTDADGTPRGGYNGMREIMGITHEESLRGDAVERLHPEDLPRFREKWAHALATKTLYDVELRVRTKEGTYRWFAMRGVPVLNEDGSVREWIGTSTDIDERKRSEEASSFVADASALLSSTMDPDAILSRLARLAVPRLADWCAIDVARPNLAHERLIIAHRDEEKAAMISEIDRDYRLPPEIDPIVNVLTTGKSQLVEYLDPAYVESFARDERHLEIIRGLGFTSWLIVPILSGGRTYGALTLVHTAESGRRFTTRDLTFVEDLASRLGVAVHNAALYVEAQAANRAKDEFLATLSHELRTPMTAILGWARLLEMGGADPAMAAEGITAIARGARAQAQLIDDLLDVSRISAGKLHLDLKDVSVNEIVRAAVEAVRATANAKAIALQVRLDPVRPHISADANRLQQVVWNLVNNAVKFTPQGGHVEISVEHEESAVLIRVADNGEGFEQEFIPHMFDRFRQADSTTTRRFGGLGLGLAIVKQITELHGGTVHAASAGAGRGATFTLTFPLAHDAASHESIAADALMPRLDNRDVLVVDDDPQARRFIAASLERAGASVRDAASAVEALESMRGRIPDVLVTDIAMPGRDGFGLLEDVRGLLRIDETRLPAVAITAFGGTQDRVRILAAGFQRYILKPVDPIELARTVAEVLGR